MYLDVYQLPNIEVSEAMLPARRIYPDSSSCHVVCIVAPDVAGVAHCSFPFYVYDLTVAQANQRKAADVVLL